MKQKTLKLLITIVMVVLALMLATNNVFASITYTTNTASITVTNLEVGVTVNIYQLTTVNYDYSADQLKDEAYSWATDELATWMASYNGGIYSTPEDLYDNCTTADAAQEFYSDLLVAISSSNLTLAVADTATATGTTVTFSDLAMGTYLVEIVGGTSVYSPSAVNLVPEYKTTTNEWELADATVAAKPETLTLTKTVGTVTEDNYSVTDTISYTITAKVPEYLEGSLATNYYISDILDSTLTLNTSSITVYGVSGSTETPLSEGTAYTASYNSANLSGTTATFVLNFDYDEISSYSTIKVTYTATLNQDATIVGTSGNSNTAYLEYTNNPYSSATTYATSTAETTVYTYGIKVTKVDKSDNDTTLSGAQFKLTDGTNDLYFVGSNGVYYLSTSTNGSATTTLEVANDGTLYLYGLDEGTYYLKETKAPDGYNLSTSTWTITLADSDVDGSLEVSGTETYTTGIYAITVENSTGFTLPVTGGTGTVIFIACGVLLIGIGVCLKVVKPKKEQN